MYLFGGFDGQRALNDVFFLELEKLSWTHLPVHVGCLVWRWLRSVRLLVWALLPLRCLSYWGVGVRGAG